MTVAVKIQVPKNVAYKVLVKMEKRDDYHPKVWNSYGSYEFFPGEERELWISGNVRISKIEEFTIDPDTRLPTDGQRSITINEDAHGG